MKKPLAFLMCVALVMSMGVVVYAASVYNMTYKPGMTDTVTNMPQNDSGMGGKAYAVLSVIPQREGYEFLGWERDYGGPTYKVTYVVYPDPVYGTPDDSIVPTDPTQYAPGDRVTVADQLTSKQETGIKSMTGEEKPGAWVFIPWDKTDFQIYEDTTITGEWRFNPYYKYTVHHLDIATYQKLADDEVYLIDELGQVTAYSKIPTKEFYTAYQKMKYNPVTEKVYLNKRKDFLLPGATYSKNKNQYEMTVTLTEDDLHIFFFYQKPGVG